MPEDELSELQARVRDNLSEKKPAFDFFKKIHLVFFKKTNEDETTIPQDLFLDVRGNLTGQLPQKSFPENFDSFLICAFIFLESFDNAMNFSSFKPNNSKEN